MLRSEVRHSRDTPKLGTAAVNWGAAWSRDTLKAGHCTAGIPCAWALQGYPPGAAEILCGWAPQQYSAVWHGRDILRSNTALQGTFIPFSDENNAESLERGAL